MSWTFQYRFPNTEDGWRASTRSFEQPESAAAAVAQMLAICALTGVVIEARLYSPPPIPYAQTTLDSTTLHTAAELEAIIAAARNPEDLAEAADAP